MSELKRIFIVGDSGAGKGVLAEAVAKKLGWKFINADIFGCTAHLGRRLSEVVGEEGEQKMNDTLTQILENQNNMENIVVTTDENVVHTERAREILKDNYTVFLTASTNILVDRLSNYRPLLPVDDFGALLDNLKSERHNLFNEVASYSLSSDDGEVDVHVEAVINAMN